MFKLYLRMYCDMIRCLNFICECLEDICVMLIALIVIFITLIVMFTFFLITIPCTIIYSIYKLFLCKYVKKYKSIDDYIEKSHEYDKD